jgi:hypothetical protein
MYTALVSVFINLFSPRYSWKITELVLSNNHITHSYLNVLYCQDMSYHTCSSTCNIKQNVNSNLYQSLLFLLNAVYLVDKQPIPILKSLVWPDQGLSPGSTAIDANMLTITPPIPFFKYDVYTSFMYFPLNKVYKLNCPPYGRPLFQEVATLTMMTWNLM